MVRKVQTLNTSQKIVNDDGTPTVEFLRVLQDNGYLADIVQNKKIIGADGTVGSGTLGETGDLTLSSNVEEILNQISTTQGVVLYKAGTTWKALSPGSAGNFLKTNGTAADPAWAAVAAGDLGPAWTTITSWGSSSTIFGFANSVPASAGFTGSTNSRMEIEAYIYKLSGTAGVLGLTNGTNGYFISAQGDGNIAFYRYVAGTPTSIGGTGVDATRNFTGIFKLKIVLHSRPSTRQEAEGSVDDVRINSVMNDVNVGIDLTGTLTPFIRTDDTTKCYVRYRVLT